MLIGPDRLIFSGLLYACGLAPLDLSRTARALKPRVLGPAQADPVIFGDSMCT